MPFRKRQLLVLVVEDEGPAQSFYRRFFEVQHRGEFAWRLASTEKKALEVLAQHPAERVGAVLLAQSWRSGSGLELLRRIKSDPLTNEVPVFLVASKRSALEEAAALEAGADDYLVEPLDPAVLRARLRATFRRLGVADSGEVFEAEDLRLDASSRSVTLGGRAVRLEPKEFEILRALLRRPNQLHRPVALWDAVWGKESDSFHHVLYSKISSLRRKLGPRWGARLRSLRGQGYALDVPARRGRPR